MTRSNPRPLLNINEDLPISFSPPLIRLLQELFGCAGKPGALWSKARPLSAIPAKTPDNFPGYIALTAAAVRVRIRSWRVGHHKGNNGPEWPQRGCKLTTLSSPCPLAIGPPDYQDSSASLRTCPRAESWRGWNARCAHAVWIRKLARSALDNS